MTPLRQTMIEELTLRGYSPRTHESYLSAINAIAKYYNHTPETLTYDEVRSYFLYLINERKLSYESCRLTHNALQFLFQKVLKKSYFEEPVPFPKRKHRIPPLLTRTEVYRILQADLNPKHQMMLTTCYGCGLRVSELVSLKVSDIDGERHLLHVEQGKGGKDRNVLISQTLLEKLRRYWQQYHPVTWLFPGRTPTQSLTIGTAQKAFYKAKELAGITKSCGIHSLRHAYATHQLEAGLPLHQLKVMLGHTDIRTTLRYIHWIPSYQEGKVVARDLLETGV